MTFRGHIQNGRVVADGRIDLPDGTAVDVTPTRPRDSKHPRRSSPKAKVSPSRTVKLSKQSRAGKTLGELLAPLKGIAKGLPRDAARNHDHYLYGTPKKR